MTNSDPVHARLQHVKDARFYPLPGFPAVGLISLQTHISAVNTFSTCIELTHTDSPE